MYCVATGEGDAKIMEFKWPTLQHCAEVEAQFELLAWLTIWQDCNKDLLAANAVEVLKLIPASKCWKGSYSRFMWAGSASAFCVDSGSTWSFRRLLNRLVSIKTLDVIDELLKKSFKYRKDHLRGPQSLFTWLSRWLHRSFEITIRHVYSSSVDLSYSTIRFSYSLLVP